MMLRKLSAAVFTRWAVLFLLVLIVPVAAEEKPRDESLDRMRALAEQTEVFLIGESGSEQVAELIPQPVFRYSDEARSIHDSTLWIWTDRGRPVALQKIEDSQHQGSGQQRWTYCLTSLADRLIRVEWAGGRTYESREPGLKWQSLPDAPEPARSKRSRLRQFRQLARRFAATILVNPKTDDQLEMRLLPQPGRIPHFAIGSRCAQCGWL